MKIRKSMCVALVLVMILSMSACGNKEAAAEAALYQQGLDVISMVVEATRSEVILEEMVGTVVNPEIMREIGLGDFSTPKAVYSISITEEALLKGVEVESLDGVSEELKDALLRRVYGTFVAQVNGFGGVEKMSVATTCSFSKNFVEKNATENTIYIYTYENAVPIMVLFVVGEEGAVCATGSPILYEGFTTNSAEEIAAFFEDFEMTVQEVQQ